MSKNGNVIVLSEEDYNNLIETLYISSIPKLITNNKNVFSYIDKSHNF